MKIHAESDRWLMRDLEEQDVEGMYALDSDPLVHRYLGNKPIKSKDEALYIITNIRQQYVNQGIGRWAVIEKASGEFMGWSGLKYETKLIKGVEYYDIGYRLRPQFWGKGYATETAIAAVGYGFTKLGYTEISGVAPPDNIASNRALLSAGLLPNGTVEIDDEIVNKYTLTQEVWQAQ